MASIALNPGFALIIGAFLALAAPQAIRAAVMALSAIIACGLIVAPPFGAYDAFAQIGLQVVPLRLDALSQVFGIAFSLGVILIAAASSSRRRRMEDVAIMLMAGGAASATFAGDLISFVAASEVSALAGAWIVLSTGGRAALAAGVRLLIWQGLGGLLLFSGIALHLADGFNSAFSRLPADSAGGALCLAGLLVKVAALLAHVWFKDALSAASPVGAAALSLFSAKLALYGLARGFSGEAVLTPVGAAMALYGALFALADDDLRRALAYSLMAQFGLVLAAIGVGAPLALAGAAAHAFTTTFSYALLFLAAGAVIMRAGGARASQLGGLGAQMPLTTILTLIGGLAAAGAPFFAGYLSESLAMEAIGRAGSRMSWIALLVAGAATASFALIRLPVLLLIGGQAPADRARAGEAPFGMLLAMALAGFFCLAIGIAPGWLLGMLPPAPVAYDAYALDRLGQRLEFKAAALAGYSALLWLGLTGPNLSRALLDADAFYRGPLALAARRLGGALQSAYRGLKELGDSLLAGGASAFMAGARGADRPGLYARLGPALLTLVVSAAMVLMFVFAG